MDITSPYYQAFKMKGVNFTASFLAHMKKDILDELGHPILTIRKIGETYQFKYQPPSIKFDIFVKEQEVEAAIIEITNILKLDDIGYILSSIPVPKPSRWSTHQRNQFILLMKGHALGYVKKYKRFPDGYLVEYDEANLKARLIGKYADIGGVGQWV